MMKSLRAMFGRRTNRHLLEAVRQCVAQREWQQEQAQFQREEDDRGWAPGYSALADRARRLGWDGSGSLWGLCRWACVRSDDCAGPGRDRGIRRALSEVEARIAHREAQVVGQAPISARAFEILMIECRQGD